ncbi:unnamed protein product, partial [Polarella glacialis]
MSQIPQTIWMLWFDGWDVAPELHRRCAESWRLFNPSWEVKTICRKDLPELLGEFVQGYEKLRVAMNPLEKFGLSWIPPAAESDLLRLMLLVRHGGVWADSTMLCRRQLDSWLPAASISGFFAYAPESVPEKIPVMSSFLASEPSHPLVCAWLEKACLHWSRPSATRPDLGFFWVHHLFGELVSEDAAHASAWAEVPRISGEYGVSGPNAEFTECCCCCCCCCLLLLLLLLFVVAVVVVVV